MTNREWIVRHLSDMGIADAICNKVRCKICPLVLPKDECRKWDENEMDKWMDKEYEGEVSMSWKLTVYCNRWDCKNNVNGSGCRLSKIHISEFLEGCEEYEEDEDGDDE